MTQTEQQKAAKKFSLDWKDKGYEKGESQKFWLDLLSNVFGVKDFTNFITFEDQVKLDHTSFIDGYISSSKVLIEQKSIDKDLRAPIKQSDGSFLNPFQQAKRYITELPVSKHPRWVVTSNFKSFLVYDMENPNGEPEEILLENLEKEYYRLSFLVDEGSVHLQKELEISKKAGDIIGEIYDAILKQYKDASNPSSETLKSLNMLCVRLVFCLYAEDAGIFGHKSIFGDYLKQFEAKDLRRALLDLFQILDQKEENRDEYLEESLAAFPYVNGGLFTEEDKTIPPLTEEIKELLVKHASGEFDWSEISPTIFGAIFESTLNPETRRSSGMHYTSIENIHKVIDPLFLDDLRAEFESLKAFKQEKTRNDKLFVFQEKLGNLKFLDPACGSGNFLTETYLSLRRLENGVISILNKGEKVLGFDEFIKVKINQFYGIEVNDFAVTVAKTALWIAENQMMAETEKIVGMNLDFLPLKTNAFIVEGNALRMNWETFKEEPDAKNFIYAEKTNIYKIDAKNPLVVCEPSSKYGKEINIVTKEVEFKNIEELQPAKTVSVKYDYIIGNPPFVGARYMNKLQKDDLLLTFGKEWKDSGDLDYVSCWYKKASDLIKGTKTKCCFVSTNSITQGTSVSILWKKLFESGIHFDFAYQTFIWNSESEQMAHVHCVIIGFSTCENQKGKMIFGSDGNKIIAKNINGYLNDAPDIFIEKRNISLNNVNPMLFGSMPNDGGNLIIELEEYDDFVKHDPASKKFIRQFMGAEEFINNKKRYCLWLEGASPAEIRKMPLVTQRIGAVKKLRESSSREATRKLADIPYLFGEIRQPKEGNYLLIPRVSSERRNYVPIGFLSSEIIASDATQIVPNATLYEFGILTSSVHMAWMRAVCGRLKSDYRYSKDIVYNNFPWPFTEKQTDLFAPNGTHEKKAKNVSSEQIRVLKTKIEQTAQAILDARAQYPDSSLADLYDELTMPPELRKAHQENDRAVMQAYGFNPKMTESEVVAELFMMYERLVENPQR